MAKKDSGKTRSDKPITDEYIAKLEARAEGDFDVDEIIRRRGGRPPWDQLPHPSSPCASILN